MPGLFTYWHTLKHLRPAQLYRRVWFRLATPAVDARPAPPLRVARANAWVAPARRAASIEGAGVLRFLNEARALDAHGWDDPALDKLWRYNLHYFDDLNARDAHERAPLHAALLARWIEENPPARGTGWEPYPTSLRIVNWIKWALAGNALDARCAQSLAMQARWLAARLELHLLGNHLFANAKALLFAGFFFSGSEAERWQATALRILRRELPEQVLADGGHFELSTMYHALALEDMLDLWNLTRAFGDAVPAQWDATLAPWRSAIARMRRWLAAMCHPDGEIAFFNDAACGIAPSPRELEHYAMRLGLGEAELPAPGLTALADSGYVRVESADALAFLDVARVGPDYLPAHAHADTLSFELSLYGVRVLVNSGTSCYGNSAERLRQRGTAAHNTVVVDAENSSEVWGGFRMARRARPRDLAISTEDAIEVRCAHDGYTRLPGRPVHQRHWRFAGAALIVEDTIAGRFGRAQARYHLHPAIRLDETAHAQGSGRLALRLPQGRRVDVGVDGGAMRSEPSTWHREFGSSEPNVCLVVDFEGSAVRTRFDWNGVT